MGHPRVMARHLKQNFSDKSARQIVELGAGDGHFLFSVASRLNGKWPGTSAILVDQLDALDPKLREQFKQLDWSVRLDVAEASAWLGQAKPSAARAIVSNLFFHQFKTEQLTQMLRLAGNSSSLVIALEPRRSWLPRVCGRLLWVIGCGPVTCHDGHISVCAGFSGRELSALWPDKQNWELTERPIGLFSHLFIARRKD
jgi:hypothetical protein